MGLNDKFKIAFCESFLDHIKWQTQPDTLHSFSLHRRHYRTSPGSLVNFYFSENNHYNCQEIICILNDYKVSKN